MANVPLYRLWTYRAGIAVLGLLVVLWSILPFNMNAGTLPPPDILFCFTMAYIIRKPELMPVRSILVVFFLRDVLTQAPLGLFTLSMVLASEAVRTNLQAFRGYSFGKEWMWIGTIFATITILQKLILEITFTQAPDLDELIYQILFTVGIYPVAAGALKFGFGFKRPPPGEFDAFGKRL